MSHIIFLSLSFCCIALFWLFVSLHIPSQPSCLASSRAPLMIFTKITFPSVRFYICFLNNLIYPWFPSILFFHKLQTYLLTRNYYYFNCNMLKIEILIFLDTPGILYMFFKKWHQHTLNCLNQKSSRPPYVLCIPDTSTSQVMLISVF